MVHRKEGELLWPERFNEQSVKELTVQLGPYRAASQLQQRPTPPLSPPTFDEIVLSVGMNFGDTKSKEPSLVVGQAWGRKGVGKYLLDEIRGRWAFAESLNHIRALITKYPTKGFKLVEKKAKRSGRHLHARNRIQRLRGQRTRE